jgi:deoxycytidylate deaminase
MIDQLPDADAYDIQSLRALSGLTTCTAAQVAAMITTPDGSTCRAINGSPVGIDACDVAGCGWVEAGQAGTGRAHARHLHAEAAAICGAASRGMRTEGAELVVTRAPCPTCALLIVAARIATVVVPASGVPEGWGIVRSVLESAGIDVIVVEED